MEHYSVYLVNERKLPVNGYHQLNLREAEQRARRWALMYPGKVYVVCFETGQPLRFLTPNGEYSDQKVMW